MLQQARAIDLASAIEAVRAKGYFDQATVTIKRFNGTLGSTGVPAKQDDSNWADVSGLVNLPCMDARDVRLGSAITASKEISTSEAIATLAMHHLLLDSYRPGILTTDRAVVTNGDVVLKLDIKAVEHVSQRTFTRLAAQEYTL